MSWNGKNARGNLTWATMRSLGLDSILGTREYLMFLHA